MVQDYQSWTAFNIGQNKAASLVSYIGYTPVVDAPVTDIATIYTILHRSIINKLNLKYGVIVCDEAVYSKIQMVWWKEPEFSNGFVVRLGEFHTMMSFMTAIAKRFDGFGFKDIVIDCGLVAEGAIKGILTGKHYYRSIMVHKIMFEALSRLRFESFLNSLDVDNRREVEDFCLLLMELHGTSKFHWYIESGLFIEIRDICSPLSGQHIDIARNNYKHLKGLRLADYNNSEENLSIDILLRASYYWKFIENSIIRGATGPVAVKSKLGYLISGPMMVNRDQIDNSTVLTSHKNIKFNGATYEVELPFKIDPPAIGDNYNLCKSRFLALEKKLARDRDLFASYNNIIKDQLSKGIIEKVSNIGDVHYLPHRPVICEDKLTSKVRIVFDASACTSGPSLNECLFSRSSLTTVLYSILLRFRAKRIVIIADIEKAFLNIALAEKHRDLVRFLWYKDLFDLENYLKSADLSVYRLCRVYDLNASFDSVAEGLLFYNKAKSCLREGNFYLRIFEFNSMEINSLIKEDNPTSSDITKVLVDNKPYKRSILRFIASFYDPLGLVNPIIVRCKILFQSICKLKFGWNSLIGDDILIEWNDMINDLGSVPFIYVPRWDSKCVDNIQIIKFELYDFCDASLKAYGCCIYLRSSAEGYANSCQVTSKSRVSPLLKNTIPKLELRAMLLLANLFLVVYKKLSCVLNVSCIKLFSDSIICLNWVNDVPKKYETFVQKRLEKIRSLYDINFWSYVESERNPADIISRGCRFSTFQNNDLWFKGSSFLFNDFVSWPSFDLSKQGDSLSEVATLIT
ncbi:uncharacterized protein LOC136088182 [Hydra vulgaris]|uniref:Uncharacterized protein LOC136088182 n=1 Tax=Hydra vulgaris TaxID=6087 RepID=A0ABM4D110_HYDVU